MKIPKIRYLATAVLAAILIISATIQLDVTPTLADAQWEVEIVDTNGDEKFDLNIRTLDTDANGEVDEVHLDLNSDNITDVNEPCFQGFDIVYYHVPPDSPEDYSYIIATMIPAWNPELDLEAPTTRTYKVQDKNGDQDTNDPSECTEIIFDEFSDATHDLIYQYTGNPVPDAQYVSYLDVVRAQSLKKFEVMQFWFRLNSTIPDTVGQATSFTLCLDENNNSSDNYVSAIKPDISYDTIYSVDFHDSKWTLSKFFWDGFGWLDKPTTAVFSISADPIVSRSGRIYIWIPYDDLPRLADVLPWSVKTEQGPEWIGDLAPDDTMASLSILPKVEFTTGKRQILCGLAEANQTISGFVTDAAITKVNYTILNGIEAVRGFAPVEYGFFDFNVTLKEGHNTIYVNGMAGETTVPGDVASFELDTWKPILAMNTNHFDVGLVFQNEEYYELKNGTKTHDRHEKWGPTAYFPKRVEINFTDKDGNKQSDLHMDYEYDKELFVKSVKLNFTDAFGNVVKTFNLQGQVEIKCDENGRPIEIVVKSNGFVRDKITVIWNLRVPTKFTHHEYYIDGTHRIIASTVTYQPIMKGGNVVGRKVRKITTTETGVKGEEIEEYEYPKDNPTRVAKKTTTRTGGWMPCKEEQVYEYDEKGKLVKITTTKWRRDESEGLVQMGEPEVKEIKDPINAISVSEQITDQFSNILGWVNSTYVYNLTQKITTDPVLSGRILFLDMSDAVETPIPSYTVVQLTIFGETENNTEQYTTFGNYVEFNTTLYQGNNTISLMVIDDAGNTAFCGFSLYVRTADLNGDRKVNILDIFAVANAFGATPSDENWNATADLNNDSVINILDIFAVAKEFGKTY